MLGPNAPTVPGEAPWRKTVCTRRRLEDIVVEPEWENWETVVLPSAEKKLHICQMQCNLTVFARPRYKSWPETHDSHAPVGPLEGQSVPAKRADDPTEVEMASDHVKRHKSKLGINKEGAIEANSQSNLLVGESQSTWVREVFDLTGQKHRPAFLALSREEQQWLLKLHRNMGHPGVQKLRFVCQQLGCSPEIQKAVSDLRSSTCQEVKRLEIPGLSAVKEPHDFGDVISMDGITWKHAAGNSFHVCHVVDQSTAFQTAVCAPSRTVESAIRALTTGWILWAGPPTQLVLDAGGEFCDDAMREFAQKNGIRLKVSPPEAHWQNSRCERHGGVLQQILTKVDIEDPINTYDKLEQALAFATQTKNQWSRHLEVPP